MPIDLWNFLGTLMPNKYGGKKFGDKLIKLSHTLKDSSSSSFYKRLLIDSERSNSPAARINPPKNINIDFPYFS